MRATTTAIETEYLVAVSLLPLLLAAPAAAQTGLVRADGIAAVVGAASPASDADVVLRSDVELRARLALARAGSDSAPTADLSPGLLDAALSEIIGEHLIAREAQRVQIVTPTETDLAQELQRLEQSVGGRERLSQLVRRLGASEVELEAIARRRALVASFLNANLEGATIVTDSEVERALEERSEEFAGEDDVQARKRLRAALAREALDRTIARWVTVLRARTTVRIYARFEK